MNTKFVMIRIGSTIPINSPIRVRASLQRCCKRCKIPL